VTRPATGITEFYDSFDRKLLRDYVSDNLRTVAAIRHALRVIPRSSKRILDIGCGIGWSSREMARQIPSARIVAVDLSHRLIEMATRLTIEPNVEYSAQDVLDPSWQPEGSFDAIVMLDVYEHIPVAKRSQLHRTLSRLLAERSVVVLSCPTPEHQRQLRDHEPAGLQPVDEDVDESTAATLATDVDARVAEFRRMSIWNPNDYAHITIARPGAALSRRAGAPPALSPLTERTSRVARQLGIRLLSTGLIVPIRQGPPVCVATPLIDAISETFIRNHITALPMAVCVVHGNPLNLDEQDRAILAERGLPGRALRKILRRLRSEPPDAARHRALARHLRRCDVAVVLAEYGPTAVDMLEPCKLAGVPLVAHFHGYDAYQQTLLREIGPRYGDLFAFARAIVVVSTHMRDQVVRLGAPREKVQVVPYGVDPRIFEQAQPGAAPPRFLAVGRFVEKKAPHLLIVAMSHVVRRCPDARLVMVGDGPLLAPCRQLAAALQIGHAVEFLGAQSHDVVARWMRDTRAFVQHSITASDGDSEGTPNSILEAQMAGVPVIATRHGGIVDSVLDRTTGLLVDEYDVQSMAENMVRLALRPEDATVLGQAARESSRARFTLEQSAERLAQVLRAASQP
jgi:glycosyltransferase involved in cell wall biosynthesis/precorrin-6B methylase 2